MEPEHRSLIAAGFALLIVNVAVAALFALAYVVIALTIAGQRGALWMALAYAVGMTKPLCDVLVPFAPYPRVLELPDTRAS